MRRIGLVVVLAFSLVLAPFGIDAQQKHKFHRFCFLTFDPSTLQANRFGSFFQALRDLGYVDGQNVHIDYLSADSHGERFPSLAADCLRLKADIIVVTTTPAQAAKHASATVPIVMIPLGDPVGTGLIASLAWALALGVALVIPLLVAPRSLTPCPPGLDGGGRSPGMDQYTYPSVRDLLWTDDTDRHRHAAPRA